MWASPNSSHPLVATPIGIFATCKRGGFVFQRATKLAKELIAQNPPQDDLQTRATSGLVFARQAAAADVAGSNSRWQQAGNRSKEAVCIFRCYGIQSRDASNRNTRKVDSQLQSRIRRHVPKDSFLIYNCVPRKLKRHSS